MRREHAALQIQKNARTRTVKGVYAKLRSSIINIQSGLRAMAARDEYRYRKRTKASILIQVNYAQQSTNSNYLKDFS